MDRKLESVRESGPGIPGGHPHPDWRKDMRNACWALIGLAALAFVVGAVLSFTNTILLNAPQAYWRGSVGFLLFAIALRMMEHKG